MSAPALSRFLVALTVLAASVAAGCFSSDVEPEEDATAASGPFVTRDGARWTLDARAGGVSALRLVEGPAQQVGFEEGVLLVTAEGRLLPASVEGTLSLAAGDAVRFVPSPGARNVTITIGGEPMKFGTPATGEALLSGDHVVDLIAHQEAEFPNRRPGSPTYAASQTYFTEYFERLGYEVEVDPYGTMAFDGTGAPAGATRGVSPASVANVVAYKEGTLDPERYIIIGGHYDVVEETTHGAFDNTGGSMAVLEMARAFANVTTSHTLVFALWGGEEDGILGSRFWVETNQDKLPYVTTYVNLDVTGVAWPGPVDEPDPFLVTAGPDGPTADELLATAQHIVHSYAKWGDAPALYQPMGVGGQVGGAGINAQSDHTSFASNGVPAFMFSTGNIDTVRSLIHAPSDTLANMTAYMVTGQAPFGDVLSEEEHALGRDVLARSFETQMWIPFYYAVIADAAYVE